MTNWPDHDRDHQTIELKVVIENLPVHKTIDSFSYPLTTTTHFKA